VLVVAAVLCLVTRAVALRVRSGRHDERLHPIEVAYLAQGGDHAVLVAALGLHAAGRLRPGPARNRELDSRRVRLTREQILQQAPTTCVVVGDVDDRHELEQAVVVAVRGLQTKRVAMDQAVTEGPAVDAVRARLGRLGLVVDATIARWVRLGALWPAAVGAFGVLRLAAGAGDGAAVLVVLTGVAFVGTVVALQVPEQTPAGRSAVADARAAVPDPEQVEVLTRRVAGVGYGTDDPAKVRVGTDPAVVAAWGPEVLWSADPLLGAALGSAPPRLMKQYKVRITNPQQASYGY
jgi:uncharacterized protein (TIGR04222 family)